MIKKVIKRDGTKVDFDKEKIHKAIMKAMKHGVGHIQNDLAINVTDHISNSLSFNSDVPIEHIEKLVFNTLCDFGVKNVAKEYEGYRKIREYQRIQNGSDNAIMTLVNNTNKEAGMENSNKDPKRISTQRDLIAGEVSKDLSFRKIFTPNVVRAHNDGKIRVHDTDYMIHKGIINCCLLGLDDMLQNGTVINGKMIEKPKSFQTACTVATQIVQQVSGGQFGGQTFSLSHLAPFVRDSLNKFKKDIIEEGLEVGIEYSDSAIEIIASVRLKKEISSGIQTIQYQVNTFNTAQGQSPFLSIFMYVDEYPGYEEETAMIIEEMLIQRYKGMKNEVGVPISPAFPKLLYVLGKSNVSKDSKYRYLTDLAIKCVSKRLMPDFISEKIMLQHYGDVFGPMGCRAWLSPWTDPDTNKLKWYSRFNQGAVSLNLVDVALTAKGDINDFWTILEKRMDLCYEALMTRHKELLGTPSDVSPIHWQHGAISRLKPGEVIDQYLKDGYSTLSLGYVGVYETVKALLGESNTSDEGEKLSLQIVSKLRKEVDTWKEKTNLGFALYATPAETTVYTFARKLKDNFGVIEGITDKDYITNSFHVNVEEHIDAFEKLDYEAQFHSISSGGCISYIEVPNLQNNLAALDQVICYMYDNIQYAEINTKSDYCHVCKFDGEILIDDELNWYCPKCNNTDQTKMNVCRRTCGYLGDNFWNKGRTEEIKDRVMHLDNTLYEKE